MRRNHDISENARGTATLWIVVLMMIISRAVTIKVKYDVCRLQAAFIPVNPFMLFDKLISNVNQCSLVKLTVCRIMFGMPRQLYNYV